MNIHFYVCVSECENLAVFAVWLVYSLSLSIGPRDYKTFFMLSSAEHEFILLINVKMPTIVGILTFISMINTTSERLKARNFFVCRYFSFYEQLNVRVQSS